MLPAGKWGKEVREVRKAERSEMQRGQKGREEEESHVIAFLLSGLQWPSVAFSSLSCAPPSMDLDSLAALEEAEIMHKDAATPSPKKVKAEDAATPSPKKSSGHSQAATASALVVRKESKEHHKEHHSDDEDPPAGDDEDSDGIVCNGCKRNSRRSRSFFKDDKVEWGLPDERGNWCRDCLTLHRTYFGNDIKSLVIFKVWLTQETNNMILWRQLFVAYCSLAKEGLHKISKVKIENRVQVLRWCFKLLNIPFGILAVKNLDSTMSFSDLQHLVQVIGSDGNPGMGSLSLACEVEIPDSVVKFSHKRDSREAQEAILPLALQFSVPEGDHNNTLFSSAYQT